MKQILQNATPADNSLFFGKNDANDLRLGEIIRSADYENSEIVILGCPQDEGVRRNGGRIGAASAPDKIREQFYKLTNFGIELSIFDLGNTKIEGSLEEIHDRQIEIIKQLLKDGKTIISLGGGNDISYPDCRALSEVAGMENISAVNIDAHFDVRADYPRNSGTPYRQLLNEKLISPNNFFEIGWQKQLNSMIYHNYLVDLDVNLISLENYKSEAGKYLNLIEKRSEYIFWGFDTDVVCSGDSPGVSAPSPLGFSAEEFCNLAHFAGKNSMTKIIEFTEVNPDLDVDNRTAKLVATAIHKFCSAQSKNKKPVKI